MLSNLRLVVSRTKKCFGNMPFNKVLQRGVSAGFNKAINKFIKKD